MGGSTANSLDGSSNAGGWDVFVMMFDSSGSWQWTVQRGGSGDDETKEMEAEGLWGEEELFFSMIISQTPGLH